MPVLLGNNDQGEKVFAVDLCNCKGDSARILTLGGILQNLNINTNRQGHINTVLGYQNWTEYLRDTVWMGATAGRYCNRIANGKFSIGASEYHLERNQGDHHLHGGSGGFHRRVWTIEEREQNALTLVLRSKDGDQGYPGNLDVQLRYHLKDDSSLNITWRAHTDRDTVVSITNHSYFNLAGAGSISNHQLKIPAENYTPTGPFQIPTGDILPVAGTCLDFRQARPLVTVLESVDPLIASCNGLDHNWARGEASELQSSAQLYCPVTGLLLDVQTTLPGLQCYTGNHLSDHGLHASHSGIALEPQYYPDSPNQHQFPSPILRAGDTRQHEIQFRFSEKEIAETS
ncbi:MAG: aldose epimerase family protein [Halioglobus sp.]